MLNLGTSYLEFASVGIHKPQRENGRFADLRARGTIAACATEAVFGTHLRCELPDQVMPMAISIPSIETRVEQFIGAARAAAATVEVVPPSPVGLSQAILHVAAGVNRILFVPPHDLSQELFAEFLSDSRVVVDPTADEMVHSAAGVTEAFAGVARTGSVCVDVSYQRSGVVSLLVPLHIVVVAAEAIVPQPRDLFRSDVLERKGLTRDFVFLTGPSATADMGPLVRGVHGPHRLHIIVLR